MTDPTTIKTINDFFSLMGRLILYCGGIAAALSGIWTLIGKIKSKGWRAATDVRIANLEDYSRKDNERLKKLEADNVAKVEEFTDIHEIMRLNLNASQQLLRSSLEGGNNRDGMQKASDEIQEYLRSKV